MTGLYIHIPFCRRKCFYCDFFSVKYDETLADKYIGSLGAHAAQYLKTAIDTVYIGGGTPSVLSENQIEKLLNLIAGAFDLSGLKEFTFELNPESASKRKFGILRSAGVNRISLGLQSDDDTSLKLLGRVHDFKTFVSAVDDARDCGFENINLDLIYGFPGQTLKEWKRALVNALSFKSPHISLYPLSVEQGTPFYDRGVQTDDALQKDMYEAAEQEFAKAGLIHYEISNWAKRGFESLHNLNYWRNSDYLALGPGACGYFGKARYTNVKNIKEYIDLIRLGDDVRTDVEIIDEKTFETENIILGLRLLEEGVHRKNFKSPANTAALEEFLRQKILICDSEKIKLAKEYVFVSNQVLSKFIPD
ncbi:MAG: radical SAM family heme chaperone HemW [Endomicrobium sp.]|jgi:oxygen-independent coproporphyrinogen-3 oxidase|nr:radical SAM family heme chaperone HemW [Endomicrobium sp.]